MSNYKILREEKNFLRLTLANVISIFGTAMDDIAFAWLVYQLVPDPRWVAIIAGSSLLPSILFQPFVAVLVERWNKKVVSILSDVAGICLMGLGLFLYFFEVLNPILLLCLTLLIGMIETFRSPAGTALVSRILSEENYNIGISFSQTVTKTSVIIGFTLTGTIIAVGGVGLAMVIDMVTFILSALILSTIHYKEEQTKKQEEVSKETKEKGAFLREFREGLAILRTSPYLMSVVIVAMGTNFLGTAFSAYRAVFLGDFLLLNENMYGFSSVILTVGALLGSLLSSKICDILKSKQVFGLGCLVIALFYGTWVFGTEITYFWLKIALVMGSLFCYGFLCGVMQVDLSVNFMKAVPQEYMSRISGLFNTLATSVMPLATLFFTITTGFLTVLHIYMLFAVLSAIFTVYVAINPKITFTSEETT
ncbi:MAG: MFS transporter [Eubacteriales bacterium]